MRKEESRFVSNGVFEGIISIRALIDGARLGTTDRKIERVLYDLERYADARKRPELMWLKNSASAWILR